MGLPVSLPGSFEAKSREIPDTFNRSDGEMSEPGQITVRVAIHPDATKFIAGLIGSSMNRDCATPLMKDLFELLRRCENIKG